MHLESLKEEKKGRREAEGGVVEDVGKFCRRISRSQQASRQLRGQDETRQISRNVSVINHFKRCVY